MKHNPTPTSDSFQKAYEQLNPAQREAVDTIEGPVLVLAGPGTGKTQTIALRIANILKQTQINPQNILCLTFTESAVHAMRSRLLKIIGRTAYFVQIHTFHSFCNEIIKDFPQEFVELGAKAEALTDVEKLQILEEIFQQLDFNNPLKPFGNPELYLDEVAKHISTLKRENIEPEDLKELIQQQTQFFSTHESTFAALKDLHYSKLNPEIFHNFVSTISHTDSNVAKNIVHMVQTKLAEAADQKSLTSMRKELMQIFSKYASKQNLAKFAALHQVYAAYQSRLRELERYDFEDMILFVVNRLQDNEELLRTYQERFQYILVDEYQDTNSAQNQTIALLGNFFSSPNIFVVGDDDQAIYRFQGASLENISFFYNLYKQDLKVIVLENNYRSQQLILDAAQSLIKNNSARIAEIIPGINKQLVAKSSAMSSQVKVYECEMELAENYFIAQQIKTLLDQGIKPSEIAVLYRDNKDAKGIASYLDNLDIKFNISRGKNVLQHPVIKQFLSLLRFIIHPENDYELFHILNLSLFKLNSLDLFKLYRYSASLRQPLGTLIAQKAQLQKVGISDVEAISTLIANLTRWSKQAHNESADFMLRTLVSESGFLDHVLKEPNTLELLNYLNRLTIEIDTLQLQNPEFKLSNFLDYLDIISRHNLEISTQTKELTNDNAVQLMTAHSAKGLEFQHVFITKVVNKKWGNRANRDKLALPLGIVKYNYTPDINEEERRLFFVALTRAKSHVYITHARLNDNQREQIPSIFISDIASEHLQKEQVAQDDAIKMLSLNLKPAKLELTVPVRDYFATILNDYRISASHLIAYQECPRCFMFKYLLKIPTLPNKSSAYGKAIHHGLRYFVHKLNEQERTPDLQLLLSTFKSALNREALAELDKQDALQNGEYSLGRYYQAKLQQLAPSSLAEFNFNKFDTSLGEIPITGIIDRIDFVDPKTINIVDYKATNPDSKSSDLSAKNFGKYFKQLVFYNLLIKNTDSLNWKINKSVIEFTEPSKKLNGDFKTAEYDVEEQALTVLSQEINEVYHKITALEFADCGDDCLTPELHALELHF